MGSTWGAAVRSSGTTRRIRVEAPGTGGTETLRDQPTGLRNDRGTSTAPLGSCVCAREPRHALYGELVALRNTWRRDLALVLRGDLGISVAYFDVISALQQLGCCEPKELASALGVRVGKALDQLGDAECHGDCRPVRHFTPGSRPHVRLTAKGQRLANAADRTVAMELRTLLGGLSPEALRVFAVGLRRLQRPDIRVTA
jgi:DNA-binding MarR family transcriptional regulator